MKNLLFVGMMFLGVALIISSMILSRPKIVQEHYVNSEVNGNLGINQMISSSDTSDTSSTSNTSDILRSYEAAVILGYSSEGELTLEIANGNVEGIPYVLLDNNYLFSKKALEEWIYTKSLN